jgi:hypothetical protein
VPEQEEQQARIVALAEVCRQYVDALCTKAAAIETLKTSVMHDLLTGRVRVSDVSKVAAS